MTKLMRAVGGRLDASTCEVLPNQVCDSLRTEKAADRCFDPQKDVTTAAPRPSAPQVRSDCGPQHPRVRGERCVDHLSPEPLSIRHSSQCPRVRASPPRPLAIPAEQATAESRSRGGPSRYAD